MKLNPQQLQAATHDKGPLLIVAGAGTGKTTVITERIKYLIQKQSVDPQHIFAASFTQKSADEMLSRLDTVMPLGYRQPWLGTFHALCERLLRLEGLEIGLDPSFRVMTQTDQWIFIKNHLYDFDLDYYRPLGNPNKFITALIKFFSRLADEATTDTELTNFLKGLPSQPDNPADQTASARLTELIHAYRQYQQLKVTESVMDFGDLITQTIHLFTARPNLLKRYQQQFGHILVDEFQDTNYAQYQLIKLLAPAAVHPHLVVVGDDNQAIYKFRGASISNILQFQADYPHSQTVVLTINYRSTATILDAAYRSIQHNNPDTLEARLGLNKRLTPTTTQRGEFSAFSFDSIESEVDWTVNQIIHLVTSADLTYQDIAILTRANSQLEPYASQLRQAGLPFQLISNHGLFDTPEVSQLHNFLKVLHDPTDTISLLQLSQTPAFNLPDDLMFQVIREAKQKSLSAWEVLSQIQDPAAGLLISTINHFQAISADLPVSRLLHDYLDRIKYLQPYLETETVENQLKLKNLNLFFEHLKRFESHQSDKSLVSYLSNLDLWQEAGENPGQAQIEDIDTISLMTIHAAKGLEFSAVFVGSLIAGRFPTYHRKDSIIVPDELIKETLPVGDEHLGEERRLFYVALTRAKHFLYLTYAANTGGTRVRHPSGFIRETGLSPTPAPKDLNLAVNSPAITPLAHQVKGGKFIIHQLSYSQIDTFKGCPLKYKYRYLLQIPAKPHHSLSFGRTMHSTLHQFHLYELQGKKISLSQLLDLYDNNFIPDGYDSPAHKLKRYDSGKTAIKQYYSRHHHLLGTPKLLEQKFTLMVDGVRFTGKIDRIDTTNTGQLEVVDYKTGSIKDQKKVDKDEQLTLYLLAAKTSLGLNIHSACLYFLEEGGHKITTTRTDQDLTKAHRKLVKDIQTIKQSDFPAKPDPVKCGFCEYRTLCPFASKPNR